MAKQKPKKDLKKKQVSRVTVVNDDLNDDNLIVRFKYNPEGELIIGANLEKIIEDMNLDAIIDQPIIEKYESMFATLIKTTGTKDMWQHAFFDVFLYALALTVWKEQQEDE